MYFWLCCLLTFYCIYWEYKLVRSVFCAFISKQNEWTDQLKYCTSLLTTFSYLSGNFRIPSRKNDSSLEAIQFWSQFSISAKEVNRWLAASFGTTNNQKEQCLENTVSAVKHPISKYFFTTRGRALWRRITLSCLYSYSGRFSRNARLKWINCSRYRSPVMESPGSAHSKQDSFGPTRYRAWSSNHECSTVVLILRSMATIDLSIFSSWGCRRISTSHLQSQSNAENLFSVVFESAVRK